MKKTFLIVLLAFSSHAHAATASQCIGFTSNSEWGGALRNNCNKTINVMYCVENNKSVSACSKKPFGLKTLQPGAQEMIPFYSDDKGRIIWAGCFDPETPADWSGRANDRYECR